MACRAVVVALLVGCGGPEPEIAVDAGSARPDAAPLPPGEGLGPAELTDGELDAPSHGGTITFQRIGAPGWYPSRRDPALGPCDAVDTDTCCLAREEVTSDQLTPWDEDLILTLRGPLAAKQLAVYQPGGDGWALVSAWDSRGTNRGVSFSEDFAGTLGSECLVDVASDRSFACGAGSEPYCTGDGQFAGWEGSKLFVLLARMDRAAAVGSACSEGTDGNWYDAPWLGLSLGELVRAGKFGDCHCYARNPAMWWLADGCGQFNAFEVVNDNNEFRNLDVFSTNFFGYAGYVGEGPCGAACDVASAGPAADLIDKTDSSEAAGGAVADPDTGPRAAFRRPVAGYRYFLILLDVPSRTVQLAIVHPGAVPAELDGLLPALPARLGNDDISALRDLRLPR